MNKTSLMLAIVLPLLLAVWGAASGQGEQGTQSKSGWAGELVAMSGKANPYPGKLGVIEKDAYADILLVDGNPLEDISVIGGNSKWFDAEPRGPGIPTIRVIMKDGRVYKNTLTDWQPQYLRRPDLSEIHTSETY